MVRQSTYFPFCRTYNRHRHLPGVGSNITKTIAANAAGGLVFASAGFGAVYAWTTGLAHGPLMASLMVVMGVALECAKPLSVSAAFTAFRRFALVRGTALALLATVAIVFSLTAELSLMAQARSDRIAERTADAKTAKSVDGHRDRIETELAHLATVRPAATLRAEIASQLIDPRVGSCQTIDGPRSKAACPKVAALRVELGDSERRERLEADTR